MQLLARNYADVDPAVVSQGTGSVEEQCCKNAVRSYSALRPRQRTVGLFGSGPWMLSELVAGWNADSHRVTAVRTGTPPRPVDDSAWSVFQNPDQSWSLWVDCSATVMNYSAPHQVDGSIDTIEAEAPNDLDAVAHLAASYILAVAANHFAQLANSSISADTVNYQQLQANYGSRAGAERAEFQRHLDTRPVKRSVRVDYDSRSSSGRERLFHGSRRT